MDKPTPETYGDFQTAYTVFNKELFAGTLPECLITMQRRSPRNYGYFAQGRFGDVSNAKRPVDEISLNPMHFEKKGTEEVLAIVVHEMVHLWQHHYGQKQPSSGYHNKEWGTKMEEVGLVPSNTGAPGGKRTGKQMTHYIDENGPFKRVCAELMGQGFIVPVVDLWAKAEGDKDEGDDIRKIKAASKTKYTCSQCSANAWAKPETKLICGECALMMVAPELEDEPATVEGEEGDDSSH